MLYEVITIETADVMPGRSQALDQADDFLESGAHRHEIADLAADMDIDADDPDARQAGGFGIEPFCLGPGYAELVALLASGNVRMAAGRHIRVHTDGDGRLDPDPA